MNAKRYVARATHAASRRLGTETMVMCGRSSTLFSLNPVASVIWQAADGVTTLDEIVERRICQEFDADPDEAMRDAEELVEALVGQGILVLTDQPAGPAPVVPAPVVPAPVVPAPKDAR
jgi:hypothetical protein